MDRRYWIKDTGTGNTGNKTNRHTENKIRKIIKTGKVYNNWIKIIKMIDWILILFYWNTPHAQQTGRQN